MSIRNAAGARSTEITAGAMNIRNAAAILLNVSTAFQIFFITLGSTTVSLIVIILVASLLFVLFISTLLRIVFGYTLLVTTMAFSISIVLSNILCITMTDQILEKHTERAGLLAVRVLQQSLWSLTFLDHPKELPELPHAVVYSVGASGLGLVNSITLMTELVLKAETGQRNVADLRVIVLPAESVFICCWMLLDLYSAWMGNKHRFRRNPNQGPPRSRIAQEMQALSQTQNGANQ